jgi:hypothetical protein
MKILRRLISRYPYRGLFGWATLCVWGFVAAEILWHLSGFVRRYDWLEIPLVVPYAPLAVLIDPHDVMLHHDSIFFLALANWFGIFLLGSVFCFRKVSAVASGATTLSIVLLLSLGRVVEYWIINPPPPIE